MGESVSVRITQLVGNWGAHVGENLWPQCHGSKPWNAVLKDELERKLIVEVCAGHISLKAAREMIVSDWTKAYGKYFGVA
jgi:hypothetical protein